MTTVRVWHEPDGSIKVTSFASASDIDAASAALKADGRVHPDAEYEDVEQADLPQGPIEQWVRDKGRLALDLSRPVPVNELTEQVDAAKTVGDLRAILKRMLS